VRAGNRILCLPVTDTLIAGPAAYQTGTTDEGATTVVAYTHAVFDIVIPGDGPRQPEFSFPMSSEQARESGSSLRLLCVCTPEIAPKLACAALTGYYWRRYPTESRVFYYYSLWVRILSIWVYDFETGAVLSRWDHPGIGGDPEAPSGRG
jgi:hypothetical protein